MSTASPPPTNVGAKENSSGKPPTKPRTRSNYHLESNPFEVSFSQRTTSPTIPSFAPPSPRLRPSSRDGNTHESKPKLPSIASMASPSAPGDFTWGFGGGGSADVNSLRAGPLSPAMLAGPAQYSGHPLGSAGPHNGVTGGSGFDVMRTGLTPDVNRTGLTPLIGGPTSFPPPSPNTAAFIAMVTNQNNASAAAGGGAGVAPPATITPGTFSAITGALLNGNGGANGDSGTSVSPTSSTHHPHPLSVSHMPNGGEVGAVDDAAHTAANGLFLLSQAHHELTKREELQQIASQRQQTQLQHQPETRAGTKGRSNSSAAAPPAAGKRKNTMEANNATGSAPANKRARGANARNSSTRAGGRRKKSEEISVADDDEELDEMMDMDGSDDEELDAAARVSMKGANGASKKPETEEEKRKNFLERNRQAALKCRQRKKAWLQQLQAKVEYLTAENERLQNTTVSMREEISRLSAVVVAHRDCGLGGVSVARSEALLAGTANLIAPNRSAVVSNVGGTVGGGAASGASDNGSGVPSNAPPAASNNHNNANNASAVANGAGVSTRGRRSAAASAASQSSSSPVPPPQMVTVGGGKGGRFGY